MSINPILKQQPQFCEISTRQQRLFDVLTSLEFMDCLISKEAVFPLVNISHLIMAQADGILMQAVIVFKNDRLSENSCDFDQVCQTTMDTCATGP